MSYTISVNTPSSGSAVTKGKSLTVSGTITATSNTYQYLKCWFGTGFTGSNATRVGDVNNIGGCTWTRVASGKYTHNFNFSVTVPSSSDTNGTKRIDCLKIYILDSSSADDINAVTWVPLTEGGGVVAYSVYKAQNYSTKRVRYSTSSTSTASVSFILKNTTKPSSSISCNIKVAAGSVTGSTYSTYTVTVASSDWVSRSDGAYYALIKSNLTAQIKEMTAAGNGGSLYATITDSSGSYDTSKYVRLICCDDTYLASNITVTLSNPRDTSVLNKSDDIYYNFTVTANAQLNFIVTHYECKLFKISTGVIPSASIIKISPTWSGTYSAVSNKTGSGRASSANSSSIDTTLAHGRYVTLTSTPSYEDASGNTINTGTILFNIIKNETDSIYFYTITASAGTGTAVDGGGYVMADVTKVTVTATTSSPNAPSATSIDGGWWTFIETSAGSGTYTNAGGSYPLYVDSWTKGTGKYTAKLQNLAIPSYTYDAADAGKKVRFILVKDTSYTTYSDAWANKYTYADITIPSPISAPTISRTTLASYTTSSSVTFEGTYTIDSSLSVSSIKVYNDNTGTTKTATVTTSSKSWTTSVTLGSGRNNLTATITDSKSQTATCTDYITKVSAPTISVTTLSATTNASSVTFKGTYTIDSNLSVSSIKVYNDNTGTTTTATVTTSSKSWTASIPLAYGKNTLTATITDSAGNTASKSDWTNYPTPAPTLSVTSPSANTSVPSTQTSYRVSGTAQSSTSTYPISTVTVNGTNAAAASAQGTTFELSVSLSYGVNTITVVATDTYGSSTTVTRTVTRAYPAPTITVTSPSLSNNRYLAKNPQNIIGKAAPYNNGSNTISSVTVMSIYNGNVNEGTYNATLGTAASDKSVQFTYNVLGSTRTNCKYAYTITATDNTGAYSTYAFTGYFSDVKPTISISTSSQTTYSNTITITGTASYNNDNTERAGLNTTKIQYGASTVDSFTGNGSKTWSKTVTLSVGDNVLTFKAVDSYGNESTASVTITYKDLASYCNVTVPFNNIVTSEIEMRQFECKAGSRNKVHALQLWENGVKLGEITGDDVGNDTYYEGIYTLGIQTDVPGKNEYFIRMVDTAGATADSAKFYVTYNNARPTITMLSPIDTSDGTTNPTMFVNKTGTNSMSIPLKARVVTHNCTTLASADFDGANATIIKISQTSDTTYPIQIDTTYEITATKSYANGYYKTPSSRPIHVSDSSGINIGTLYEFTVVAYVVPTVKLGINGGASSSGTTYPTSTVYINGITSRVVSAVLESNTTNEYVKSGYYIRYNEQTDGSMVETYRADIGLLGNIIMGQDIVMGVDTSWTKPQKIQFKAVLTTGIGGYTGDYATDISSNIITLEYWATAPTVKLYDFNAFQETNQIVPIDLDHAVFNGNLRTISIDCNGWGIAPSSYTGDISPTFSINGGENINIKGLTGADITGGQGWLFTYDIPLGIEDTYDLSVDVTDVYGNTGTGTGKYRVWRTAPFISLTHPIVGLITNDKTKAGRIEGMSNAVISDWFATIKSVIVNEQSIYLLDTTASDWKDKRLSEVPINAVLTLNADGQYSIDAVVSDVTGNISSVHRSVILDTKPPIISDVTADSISVDTNGVIHINLKVNDPN